MTVPQQVATTPILAPGAHMVTTDMGLQAQLQHQIQLHQTPYASMNTALPGSIVAASQLTAAPYLAAMLPGGMHRGQGGSPRQRRGEQLPGIGRRGRAAGARVHRCRSNQRTVLR